MNQYEVNYKYAIDHASYTAAMDTMTKRLERFLGLLKRYDRVSKQVEKATKRGEAVTKKATQSVRGLSTAYEMVENKGRRYAAVQRELTKTVGKTSAKLGVQKMALQETANRMRHFSTEVASLRSMMIGFYAVQGVKSIVSAGYEFSKQLIRIQANTGATADEMARIKKISRDLNLGSIFNPAQIAEGVFILTKAGESLETAKNMMGAVVNLATIAEIDPAQGADILHSIMKQYSIDLTEATHVTDILAYAQTKSKLSTDQIFESLKNVGGIASAIGIPLETTLAHLAAIKESGIGASKAGTVLMNMYQRMIAMSDKGKKTAGRLGIRPDDFMQNGVLQAEEFLQAIKDAGATAAQLKDMFEMRGQRAAMPMMKWLENATQEAGGATSTTQQTFGSFLEGMKEVDGYAEAMASRFLTGLYGALTKLGSAFYNLKTRMSDVMEPVIKGLGNAFTWLIEKLTRTEGFWGVINAVVLGFFGTLMLLTAAMFLILIPLGLIAGAIASLLTLKVTWTFVTGNLTGSLGKLTEKLVNLPKNIGKFIGGCKKAILATWGWVVGLKTTLIPAIKSSITWIKTQTAALWANTVAWLSNPIGIIITLIVVALATLVYWFVKAYQKMGSVIGAFKQMGATIMYYLVKPLQAACWLMEKVQRGLELIGLADKNPVSPNMFDTYSDKMQGIMKTDVRQTLDVKANTAAPTVQMIDNRPLNVNVNNSYNKDIQAIQTQISSGLGYTGSGF